MGTYTLSDDRKKRCSAPQHEGNRWLPVSEFHKRGIRRGVQEYDSWCRTCKNDAEKERYHNGNKGDWQRRKAYQRARSKALTRLTHLVPELFARVMREELEKEGLSAKWIDRRLEPKL